MENKIKNECDHFGEINMKTIHEHPPEFKCMNCRAIKRDTIPILDLESLTCKDTELEKTKKALAQEIIDLSIYYNQAMDTIERLTGSKKFKLKIKTVEEIISKVTAQEE